MKKGIFFAIVALAGLRLASVADASAVVIVAGGIVVLGYLILPLLYGVDDAMDPRKFSLFGIPTTRLSLGLAVSALVSIPRCHRSDRGRPGCHVEP